MKKIKFTLLAFMAAMMAISFTACSDDRSLLLFEILVGLPLNLSQENKTKRPGKNRRKEYIILPLFRKHENGVVVAPILGCQHIFPEVILVHLGLSADRKTGQFHTGTSEKMKLIDSNNKNNISALLS